MSARPATPNEPSDSSVRARLAERLSRHLERVSHPRAQMALLVSATGSAGFFVDWLLLKAGIGRMSLRYVLAVLLSYGVFLLLIKVWLVFHYRRQERADSGSSGSSWFFSGSSGSGGSSSGGGGGGSSSSFVGGGGDSGGGGASASFDEDGAAPIRAVAVPMASSSGSSGGSSSGGFGIDLDGDEIVAIVAVVVAVGGAFVAAGYLVVQAPAIFGEVLLDGTLSAGLYKRLKTLEHRTWLEGALRKTVIPFAAVAVLAGAAGHFMQKVAPEARSIGGVYHHIAG